MKFNATTWMDRHYKKVSWFAVIVVSVLVFVFYCKVPDKTDMFIPSTFYALFLFVIGVFNSNRTSRIDSLFIDRVDIYLNLKRAKELFNALSFSNDYEETKSNIFWFQAFSGRLSNPDAPKIAYVKEKGFSFNFDRLNIEKEYCELYSKLIQTLQKDISLFIKDNSMDCKNVRVSGVSMRNSAVWCFGVFGCENVEIDDVKIFGQWRYNTDGIDLVNSSNVVLKNSFIHSFDDAIVLKGVVRFCAKNIKNILVENCVVWCDWGRAIEIGIETVAKSFEDITFKNCDVIRGGCAALDIQNGNEAEIHNVLYEKIRVEFNAFDTPEVYQHSDVQVYDKTDELAMPKLISVSNPRLMRVCRRLGYAPENIIGGRPASVHDVVYKDVVVYYDANLPQLKDIKIETKDEFNDGRIYNICLPDVHII